MNGITFNGDLGIEVLVYRCLGCGCRINWIEMHTGCGNHGSTLAPEGTLVAASEEPEGGWNQVPEGLLAVYSEEAYGDRDKLAGDVARPEKSP